MLFVFGTLAASVGWDISFLWWLSGACAIIALWRMRDDPMAMGNVLVVCGALPLAAIYCHLRGVGLVGASATTPSFSYHTPSEPLLGAFEPSFSAVLSYREASLLHAIFNGSTAELPPDVKSAMMRAGTSYIVGMYGFKIHLLADTAKRLASSFISRRLALGVAIGAVAIFIAYAGAPRAAMRAGAMTIFVSLAEMAGRHIASWRAFLFTGLALVIIDPSSWNSPGFLLSFASIAGIFVFADPLQRIFKGRDILYWKSHAAMAFAVNVAIIPLVAVSYGSFPMISFFSNIAIAMPFSAIMVLGTALALLRVIVPYAAFVLGPPLAALLGFQIIVSRIFGAIPIMISGAMFSPPVIVAYYAILGVCAYLFSASKHPSTSSTLLFRRLTERISHA